jgi:hypothetical protein
MSRPIKQGLDYFPLDVDMDDKIELIEAKHGISGFGILVKIYQKIYKEGYYLNWNEESLLLFSKRINADRNLVDSVIKDGLCYNVFDENLYAIYKILTSTGIQKRYLNAIDRRKEVILDKRYVNVDTNDVNVNIIWINDSISTQSKVKESKEYIYNDFYDSEIEKNSDPQYLSFVKFLFKENGTDRPLIHVLKLSDQIGYEQFKKIKRVAEEHGTMIYDKVRALENKKAKGYSSFYLTLNEWLKHKFERADVR